MTNVERGKELLCNLVSFTGGEIPLVIGDICISVIKDRFNSYYYIDVIDVIDCDKYTLFKDDIKYDSLIYVNGIIIMDGNTDFIFGDLSYFYRNLYVNKNSIYCYLRELIYDTIG